MARLEIDIEADIARLQQAMATGALRVRTGDHDVYFKSFEQMRNHLAMLRGERDAVAGTAPLRRIQFQTGKGLS